ncbi:unnamed protein product [Prunus armeniaca]|uniref:Uncharacterized protein n=1 Tax=Prunus armeniaca TaxID=36596 RepID=A0A6J5XSA6_PRUAR|nr:hypothetical protein GBA52_015477 [Prunus armeniaca]CAB4279764.1 unnamed protein product [Prunus armeniaca]CAB4316609.1 unnamed protein product [Prunus armeniaca]
MPELECRTPALLDLNPIRLPALSMDRKIRRKRQWKQRKELRSSPRHSNSFGRATPFKPSIGGSLLRD